MMDRPTGTSAGQVTLFWSSYTGVSDDPAEWNQLRVAHYKSGQWQSEGPGSGAIAEPGFSYDYGYLTSDAVSTFSPFTFGSLNVFNPLPVELLDLTASPVDKSIRVNWVTANEHNSSHFILQRSADGIRFSDIATIQAAGESKQVRTYTYLDKLPLNGVNYYRLQQVDKDNTSGASKIVSAHISDQVNQKFEVYPNPSDGKQLYIQVPYKGEITVTLLNMAGAEVYAQRTMADGSFASVQPSHSLATGMYVVRVSTGKGTYQQKLLVK
ncbi:T9SS type A sorting domain-containing protein [Rhodocytophaga rosea]|uniref:T9SS type A sorting domain-containing protein n=1 Tax=Rhodocytophaga rosea TaxID=2704465 RepID=A0A6C0GU16_9BACT|nr:T9SS type A sorting domain-containing protein [Rhodocytophaga rosea]QHT71043.1 T9SS type A sorting domain-containing protein [Rhodocytophaga rosea]